MHELTFRLQGPTYGDTIIIIKKNYLIKEILQKLSYNLIRVIRMRPAQNRRCDNIVEDLNFKAIN